MASKMNLETLYRAKVNQVRMMRYRGYTDDTTMAVKIESSNDNGYTYSLDFRSDDLLISDETSFGKEFDDEDFSLNTYHRYIDGEQQYLIINYWLSADNGASVSQSEVRTMLAHVHDIENSFPSMKVGQINVYCNDKFTSQSRSSLEMDVGYKIRTYTYLELRPLTHVQLPKYRLLTPDEKREFPYATKELIVKIPRMYEGCWTSKYNGWSAGDIVEIVRKTPHHLSVMSNTINYRLIIPGTPPVPKFK